MPNPMMSDEEMAGWGEKGWGESVLGGLGFLALWGFGLWLALGLLAMILRATGLY